MSSTPDDTLQTASPTGPRAHLGWRLLALFYDLWPALALWMLLSLLFTLTYTFGGHHASRQNIAPFSAMQWLLWACCWLVTGLYATLSWRHGGQTLGMRPWRILVVDVANQRPTYAALWLRYAVGTLSLLAGGVGFWWAWIDRERLTLHDRLSGTRVQRRPKPPRP
jgi:uncharacterized RDD family membrane protein YckC